MTTRASHRSLRILTIDIGGSHIKAHVTGSKRNVQITSGPRMTPRHMVDAIQHAFAGSHYDVVSIGYPGLVSKGVPRQNPPNLGNDWVGFKFARAFHRPVKVINDAAMQALGCYHGGKMLFLGFGTGLGSALILDGVLHPMELGDLPFRNGRPLSDFVKKETLQRIGRARWSRLAKEVICLLSSALQPDYTVIGGGQARLIQHPPPGTQVVDNSKAFLGGIRLWQPPAWFQRLAGAAEL